MAIRMTALPSVVLCLAVGSFCVGIARGQSSEQGPTLVDFASNAAVFSRRGELMLVRVGEKIAGTAGRLDHVGQTEVRVEYLASGQSLGGILLLERLASVPISWPVEETPRAPIPLVTVSELSKSELTESELEQLQSKSTARPASVNATEENHQ